MYTIKILYSFFQKYIFSIIAYLVLIILSFPLEAIVVPQIYSHFFSILNKKTEVFVFIKYFLVLSITLLIITGAYTLNSHIESYIIPELSEYFINYIFKNLLKKYENNYEDLELGKIVTNVSVIPQYLKDFISEFFVWILPRFIAIIIINLYFFYLDFGLGLISTLLFILFIYISIKYFNQCSTISNERHLLFQQKNQDTQDKLSNTYLIYSNGNLHKEIKDYEDKTKTYTNKFKENMKCVNTSSFINNLIIFFIFIILNSYTTYLYKINKMSFNNLIAIFITIIYYTPCIVTINSSLPNVIHYFGAISAIDNFIEELYKTEKINKEKENMKIIEEENNIQIIHKITKGIITINNLDFGYHDKNILFHHFYLTLKENEKVAIVGPSGNGKSTLIKLIMGYYKVPNNVIFFDSIDINQFELNELRKQISYVNQNNKLFNKSILENIQYGNHLQREDVNILFNKLNLKNIFSNLPDGLDTSCGVDGNNLSGGQRQLVHILRCMGKKNKIIILDEPTTAIDQENMKVIMNVISELGKNNTLILITHDDSMLQIVDRVIKLQSGKIIKDEYIHKK
jgi:ABC-type multidrug transport system fused ATPase/permease subunit